MRARCKSDVSPKGSLAEKKTFYFDLFCIRLRQAKNRMAAFRFFRQRHHPSFLLGGPTQDTGFRCFMRVDCRTPLLVG